MKPCASTWYVSSEKIYALPATEMKFSGQKYSRLIEGEAVDVDGYNQEFDIWLMYSPKHAKEMFFALACYIKGWALCMHERKVAMQQDRTLIQYYNEELEYLSMSAACSALGENWKKDEYFFSTARASLEDPIIVVKELGVQKKYSNSHAFNASAVAELPDIMHFTVGQVRLKDWLACTTGRKLFDFVHQEPMLHRLVQKFRSSGGID